MGFIVIGILNLIAKKLLDLVISGTASALQAIMNVRMIFSSFELIDTVFQKMRVIAMSLFVLVVLFQVFKSMFAYLGFETDEPWKIGGRALFFGFMAYNAKDFCLYVLNIYQVYAEYMWTAALHRDVNVGADFCKSLKHMVEGFGLFSFEGIVLIYLGVKLLMLIFKFCERMMFMVFLILSSPLAFVAGVGKNTKGFLQGWLKVFMSNIIMQLMQITVFISIPYFIEKDDYAGSFAPGLNPIISLVMVISVITILGKLEEILKDMSFGIGMSAGILHGPVGLIGSLAQPMYPINMLTSMFGGGAAGRMPPAVFNK